MSRVNTPLKGSKFFLYKYVRYCIKCKKRFTADIGQRVVCYDCRPMYKKKEVVENHDENKLHTGLYQARA